MLQRLNASLTSGPGLNARPHHSRQRIDVVELRHLQGTDPAALHAELLGHPERVVQFPAKVPPFHAPDYPVVEWSDEQKRSRAAADLQNRLLEKLRDIAEDATDYYNDHGEHSLYVGFPLLSLPPVGDRECLKSGRILAPLMLVPVNLTVRRGAGAGISLAVAATGADLVQPNPALLAWIEQQTGQDTEELFADEAGEEPWREIAEVLKLVSRATALPADFSFTMDTRLAPVPRTDQLPPVPALLPSAVLGLFPVVNPGLMRDTKWMMANEPSLQAPVKPFLSSKALAEPEDAAMPEAPEFHHESRNADSGTKDFAQELLVTQADPCQAAAVAHARRSEALVVHGPPGTGKSQTIANIIGDHLARGERVLFVCDKRTALDVVKFRLDGMGLGALCGVIHDPQRDRRDLYLGLRDRLENLAQEREVPDPARELASVNERLNRLHRELRGSFDGLHGASPGERSFHQLCGEWLALQRDDSRRLPDVEGLTGALMADHRTDAEEIVRRALSARWPENPFAGRLGMSVSQWLATTPAAIRASMEHVCEAAAEVDSHAGGNPVPLDPGVPVLEQAAARGQLADRLEAVARRGLAEVAARLAGAVNWQRWQTEAAQLSREGQELDTPLERELNLQVKGSRPALGECNQRLLAIDEWMGLAGSFKRFFAWSAKKAAREALRPLALGLEDDHLQRGRQFYRSLRARHLWCDLRDQILETGGEELPEDSALIGFRDGLAELIAVLECASEPVNVGMLEPTGAVLENVVERAADFIADLRISVKRAEAIHELEKALATTGLFSEHARRGMSTAWRSNQPATELCDRFLQFGDSLDDAVRLTERLEELPLPLALALRETAALGMSWNEAEPALREAALTREIRHRIQEDESLARIDTQRVEAAFSELLDRMSEKCALVRQVVLHHWQRRWRSRLLAATGSRLNSLGAGLRQRLFVRGQKAMKLRQMIAAGAGQEGGDPLFDLCPVWMASPATVAQIFPREPLFDVVVFDEASQCRLEEALPVLLRGRRVVVAGDPKQLPPTRFFEQSLTESDDVAAESAEEMFAQVQSEAEDLLSSALNLNVQEAFLDVHYRSRNEALIGFSNTAFYGGRLQPIPGHPRNKAAQAPIELVRVDGVYEERGNVAEAKAAARLVAELLDDPAPPSIGVACFNLNQRDLILDAMEELAEQDRAFSGRLEAARRRRGRDSFEGLFVKNLENVQGDERDHIIISTTFGPDPQGKFRRNFGALSRTGGERRLNVLVTRARSRIHVLTSIPRAEYLGSETVPEGQRLTGRHQLYGYLRYAERLEESFDSWQKQIESARAGRVQGCQVVASGQPSPVAEALGRRLLEGHGIGSTVHWGNEGFCIDVALTHPGLPFDVTVGVLTDFTRYLKTPDPIAWEQFRSAVLGSQGWELHRVWSPALFRDPAGQVRSIVNRHRQAAAVTDSEGRPARGETSDQEQK